MIYDSDSGIWTVVDCLTEFEELDIWNDSRRTCRRAGMRSLNNDYESLHFDRNRLRQYNINRIFRRRLIGGGLQFRCRRRHCSIGCLFLCVASATALSAKPFSLKLPPLLLSQLLQFRSDCQVTASSTLSYELLPQPSRHPDCNDISPQHCRRNAIR
jgi:hypothetical protein